MSFLHLRGSRGSFKIEITPTTTLLDIRHQLFSLTDIPPESLYLVFRSTIYAPNEAHNSTQTILSLNIPPNATLAYSDRPVQSRKVAPIDISTVGQAIAACGAKDKTRHGTHEFFLRIQSYYDSSLEYEDKDLQQKALRVMPLAKLEEQAVQRFENEGDKYVTMKHAVAKEILHWFKTEFFTWMNAPKCWACGKDTKAIGMTQPTQAERKYRASRVELYQCECGAYTRFARYRDAAKLLETRKGRCGEWAQAFTLIMKAAGYVVRNVHDWTDHVWTEVWLDGWIHMDSCEDVMNEPLLYESGWGKKLTFCIATGEGGIVDVTKRYTNKWEEVKGRRNINESRLKQGLDRMNERVMKSEDARIRWEWDMNDLQRDGKETGELPGRQSGNKDWVKARGEDGGYK